jgi:DNA invertase Pin-like site-specific DNA recombinase
MSPKRKNQTLVGYTRVSQVGGREGESFISPELQKEAIRGYAAAHGHKVVWLEPDLDVSGKSLDRPAFQKALAMVREGKADGIIAARLDRLTRKVSDLGRLVEWAETEKWNLVAVDFGLDFSTSNGKLVANILGSVAEWELDNRTDGWRKARENAVIERGIHVCDKAPIGYVKGEDGTLRVEPETAPAVTALFKLRAQKGTTWSDCVRLLKEAGIDRNINGVRKIVQNRVYLGEARSGDIVNPGAHEALVDDATWRAAQPRGEAPRKRTSDGYLLAGLIYCQSCGRRLSPGSGRYRCRPEMVKGEECSAPAQVPAGKLEVLVLSNIRTGISLWEPEQARPDLAAYDRAVATARNQYEGLLRADFSDIDPEAFRAALSEKKAAVGAAEDARREAAEAGEALVNLQSFDALTVAEQRRFLARLGVRVTVRRAYREADVAYESDPKVRVQIRRGDKRNVGARMMIDIDGIEPELLERWRAAVPVPAAV